MELPDFSPQKDECVVYQLLPDQTWYLLAWKAIADLFVAAVLTAVAFAIFFSPLSNLLSTILPAQSAEFISLLISMVVIPLLLLTWAVEDIFRAYVGKLVLSDQRLWVRGTPYAWSFREIPIEDISSMYFRHNAIFIRRKSTRKILVHMDSDGEELIQAYQNLVSG